MNHPDLVAQTIFCETARLEVRGQVTLVGIFPDNINFNAMPIEAAQLEGMRPQIPAFCLYTRIRMPLSLPVKDNVDVLFLSPSGQKILEAQIERSFIEKTIEEARGQDSEYILLTQQAELAGFPIMETGRHRVIVNYAGNEYFSGAIRFTVSEPFI